MPHSCGCNTSLKINNNNKIRQTDRSNIFLKFFNADALNTLPRFA